MSDGALPGRALALDVGERRVGVAISDETQTLARSLTVLERGSGDEDLASLVALVCEYKVAMVVVGLPISLDETEGPQARRTRRYAEALSGALDEAGLAVPLIYRDESYSTATASKLMIASGRGRRDRRQRIDAVAAAVILQDYLDAQ